MTQTVSMPDGTVHNFPDEATPQMISGALGLNSPTSNVSQLQPNNFMERVGMASAGDTNQQTDIARQTALYSKNAMQGLLNTADVPAMLYSIPGALTHPTTPAAPLVQNISSAVQDNPFAPNLGQKFSQFADQYNNGQVAPQDNREKVIAAEFQGAGSGLPFGPLGMASGVVGGGVQQTALNHGLSPDQAAALGLLTSGAVAKGPEILDSATNSIANTASDFAKGVKGLNVDDMRSSADNLKDQYSPNYNLVRDTPLGVQGTKDFLNNVNQAATDFRVHPQLHPQTSDILEQINQEVKSGDNITVDQANIYKKLLQDVSRKDVNNVGQAGPDSGAASSLIGGINDSFSNIPELKTANSFYSAGSKYDKITDLVQKSDGDVGKLQNTVKTFLRNDKNLRGFSDDDVSSLQAFANGNIGENFLGLLGKAGIDFNKLASVPNMLRTGAAGGVTAFGGGGSALPIVAGGTLAKLALNALKRGQLQSILENFKPQNQTLSNLLQANQNTAQAMKLLPPPNTQFIEDWSGQPMPNNQNLKRVER